MCSLADPREAPDLFCSHPLTYLGFLKFLEFLGWPAKLGQLMFSVKIQYSPPRRHPAAEDSKDP